MQNTYKYIIFSILWVLVISPTNAQTEKKDTTSISGPWFNGLRAEIDLAPIVSSFMGNGEIFSYEGAIQAYVLNKYYPVLEIGYAGANHSTLSDINYKTNGMFARLGVDFNLVKPKKGAKPINNVFLAGARLGFSSFKYDMTNIVVTDDYWNETTTLNFSNEPATKLWFEVVAGMRVEIFKNIYMGWSIRNRHILGQSVTGEMSPWYIPGFGKNINGSNWGVNYSVGYKF